MSEPNDLMQRVGEKQIARILQRAAALQERDRQRGAFSSDVARGVSLTELKQIAGEVGIDPRYVEAAAVELHTGEESPGRFLFWGAPGSSEFEQTVEGEVRVEEWDGLVARIRRSAGNIGRTSTLGQSLQWTGQADHVSISPKEGRTTIRILSGHQDSTAMAHLVAFTASVFTAIPVLALFHGFLPEAAGFTAVAAGGMFGLARLWAAAMFRSHRDKMEALLQEIAEHTTQSALPASQKRSLSEPRIAADAAMPAELHRGGSHQPGG